MSTRQVFPASRPMIGRKRQCAGCGRVEGHRLMVGPSGKEVQPCRGTLKFVRLRSRYITATVVRKFRDRGQVKEHAERGAYAYQFLCKKCRRADRTAA